MKQETLEEAAENRYVQGVYVINGIDICESSRECFIDGAKWMQERMYSEEEVRLAYFQGEKDSYIKGGQTKEMENEFIESLKQKHKLIKSE